MSSRRQALTGDPARDRSADEPARAGEAAGGPPGASQPSADVPGSRPAASLEARCEAAVALAAGVGRRLLGVLEALIAALARRWAAALARRPDSPLARAALAAGRGVLELWRRTAAPDPVGPPYTPGSARARRVLWRSGLLGFVATAAIVAGASQPNSPFTLKLGGAWWFGIPAPSQLLDAPSPHGSGLFLGVVAVYGGMVLLIRAWYDVVRLTTRHRGIPVKRLVPLFLAWSLPLLFVAPLFSHDLYSYAAQGEMTSHHINPYSWGPQILGAASPFGSLVDKLWQNVPSPYGPAFLTLDAWIVSLTGHNPLASVEGLRLLALAGVAMFAWAIPVIARSYGRDPAVAFSLSALSPLVLLHLVGGGHNDALMLGVMAIGYALARRGRPVAGLVVIGLAAAVKVPAILAALYVGWDWLGTGLGVRARIRPVMTAMIVSVGTMAIVSEAAGLGWGWIGGLTNPDAVRSWLDPATGLGLLAGHVVSALGIGSYSFGLITLFRGLAMLAAIVIGVALLLRSDEIGALRAMGWTLVAVVLLGPVVQPWYASWGFVFLAPVVVGRVRRLIVAFSAASCFLGLPGGRVMISGLALANPVVVAVAAAALVAIAVAVAAPHWRAGGGGRSAGDVAGAA